MFWVARNELGEFTDQRVDTSLRSSFSTWNCKTFGTDQSAIRKRPPMPISLQNFTRSTRNHARTRVRSHRRRPLRVESLEHRRVLTCLGTLTPTITGTAFQDLDGNNMPSAGEELQGVQIQLFQATDNSLVGSQQTGATGGYCFENLDDSLTYYVRQPQQTVDGSELSEQQSGSITPGQFGVMIDAFRSSQTVVATPPAPKSLSNTLSSLGSEAIGGSRKIFAHLGSGDRSVEVSINPFGGRETMQYNSDVGVTGSGRVAWDGTDGTPDPLMMGLNGVDLTQSGANTGIALQIGALIDGSTAMLRLYQGNASNYSEASFDIPRTNNGTAQVYGFINFSNFNGSVSPTNVDAITFEIDSTNSSTNGVELDAIGANGPKLHNFANLPEADLSVTKQNQGSSIPGETIEYEITVSNAGPSAVTGARVVDNLPAALDQVTFTSQTQGNASGNTTSSNGNIDDSVTMDSGSSITYTVSATIDPNASGELSNTVTVTAPQGVVDPNPNNNTATENDTLNPQVDMSITKDNGVDTLVPGSSVDYTIVVTNSGPSQVDNATVSDTFPTALTQVSYTSSTTGTVIQSASSGNENILDTVTMSPGATITYNVQALVDPNATGQVSNTASVALPNGVIDPTPGDNTATDTDTLQPEVDLLVQKVSPTTQVEPNESISYTITVRNEGPSTAAGTRLSDVFPASLLTDINYSSTASAGASGNTTSGVGNIDDVLTLQPGANVSYTVDATVLSSALGEIENTATATLPAGTTETNPGDNTATNTITVIPVFDLSITKTNGATTVVAGQEVVYTITVGNSGPSEAMNVDVSDAFPPELQDVTFSSQALGGATGNRATGSGDINDMINLPANASVIYTASGTLASSATGTLSNTAFVAAADSSHDQNPNNNSSTSSSDIRLEADLTMTKTASQDVFEPGDDVMYQLVVTNEGPSDVIGAKVTDVFPDAMPDDPASFLKGLVDVRYTSQASGGASGNANGQGDIDQVVNLPAGSSITYTVDASVSPFAMEPVKNEAEVEAPNGVMELNPTNNSSSVTNSVKVTLRSIEGFVFVDKNKNGERDPGDPGIPDVDIALSGTDIFNMPVQKDTVTESDGSYAFNNLQPGGYTITQTPPAGFPDGGLLMGKGAVIDPTIADHVFQNLVLGEAQDATDYDFRQLRPNFSKRLYLAST